VLFPSALVTGIIALPLGIALQKGASAKILMTVGMAAFSIFCWELGQQTMQSGAGNFFWILLLRGVALGFIFIPVTMLAVAGLHGKDIGQATGLNNMVRQLGGSFGIALTNTYIVKRVAEHRNEILSNLSPYDPAAVQRLQDMKQALGQYMSSPVEAGQAAMAALEGIVVRQSYHLAYMDAFKMIAILFAVCLPLLLFIRVDKKETVDMSSVH